MSKANPPAPERGKRDERRAKPSLQMHAINKQPATGADQPGAAVADETSHGDQSPDSAPALLAIDCGLKTGLALFDRSARLLWYRSQNFGSRARLKTAAWKILKENPTLTLLVVEGGGPFAEIWVKQGHKCGLLVTQVQAERWRKDLLLPRQQRSGKQAKQVADELAREVIERSCAARPTSLRHDAAEAILVGWWALQR